MIAPEWLSDRLVAMLRWQLTHPGVAGGPEVPWAGRRVWGIFIALNRASGSNGWGPNPISYGEIEAYARLMREPVRPFEVEIIMALNAAYLEHAHAAATGKQDGIAVPRSSGQVVTPAAFDAVFGKSGKFAA